MLGCLLAKSIANRICATHVWELLVFETGSDGLLLEAFSLMGMSNSVRSLLQYILSF